MLDQDHGTGFVLAVARATLLPHRPQSVPGSLTERLQVDYEESLTEILYWSTLARRDFVEKNSCYTGI